MVEVFDERTMNARIVDLAHPTSTSMVMVSLSLCKNRQAYRSPSSRETGQIAVVNLIVVAAVITRDFTHRSLHAGGDEAPESAVVSDDWLVVRNQTAGTSLHVYDLTADAYEPVVLSVPEFDLNSTFTNQGDTLVVTNATSLLYYDLNAPENSVQTMPFE